MFVFHVQNVANPAAAPVDISKRIIVSSAPMILQPSTGPTPSATRTPAFAVNVVAQCSAAFITSDIARACCTNPVVNCAAAYQVMQGCVSVFVPLSPTLMVFLCS